ncbi:MAG: pantetheine-phosphate adenylyltransferase [Planctomycetes bacterium]|nr:pantetheine-phosphate adenylyltransferase [Planctomycetota bacterium]
MADQPRALYPGTFDPPTLGHLDLIRRGVDLFGPLLVAVANNNTKKPLFTAEERIAMIQAEVGDLPVTVEYFRGLVVEHARERGISVILRGVRTVSDFEYEYQMAMTNRTLEPKIETAFVMPSEKYSYLSSRLIKEVYASGGELRRFLPEAVHDQLIERLSQTAS